MDPRLTRFVMAEYRCNRGHKLAPDTPDWLRLENARLRAALEAIAAKECVTPDIHFVQVVDIARRALD